MFHPIELQYEWEIRTNRPSGTPSEPLASEWDTVLAQGPQPLNAARSSSRGSWLVVVNTYDRPETLAQVLLRLRLSLERADMLSCTQLLVLQDRCRADYSEARAQAERFEGRVAWLHAKAHFGKAGFWRIHQTVLDFARRWNPERALYIQDDVHFEVDLLECVEQMWQETAGDPERRALYLFSSAEDEPNGRWTYFPRRTIAGKHWRQTNWLDLQAFVVDRRFFELMDYRMVPVHPNRWKRQPRISSGVGRQFTLRLRGQGHVYQAWPPLVMHGITTSKMNAHAREVRSLDNTREYRRSLRSRLNALSY